MISQPVAFIERSHPRRRTFKAGSIAIVDGSAKLECSVRDISEGGARLLLSASTDAPDTFELSIASDGLEADCNVRWRRGREIGVQYVAPPRKVEKKCAPQPSHWAITAPRPTLRRQPKPAN